MQDAGLAASPVLRRAQLPGDLFARQNVRLDPVSFFKLWVAIEAEAASINADLPAALQIAKVMSSDWFDPELFAALCSANLGGALDRSAKYVRLIAPMVIRVDRAVAHTTHPLTVNARTRFRGRSTRGVPVAPVSATAAAHTRL